MYVDNLCIPTKLLMLAGCVMLSNHDRYPARCPCYSAMVLLIIPPQFSISKGFTQRSRETRLKNAIWRRTNKISPRTNQIPNGFAILTSDRFPAPTPHGYPHPSTDLQEQDQRKDPITKPLGKSQPNNHIQTLQTTKNTHDLLGSYAVRFNPIPANPWR